jgi:glycosyltransferase involved in cell wall biosynthesis
MRLAYDHQIFCLQKAGGISRYFCKLLGQLNKLEQTVSVFAPFYRNQYLRQIPTQWVRGCKVADYPKHCADLSVALNGFVGRRQLKAWHPELVHETYFSKIRSGSSRVPSVLTVFDMIGELGLEGVMPTQAKMKSTSKYAAVSRADHIVCISEHTRQDLIRLFEVPAEKISTIHLGCDQDVAVLASQDLNQVTSTARASFSKPYLLYVGLRKGYKNFAGLLRSVASSNRLKNTFDIIAFGGEGFTKDEHTLIGDLKFAPEQVKQVSGDDRALIRLYQQAAAFVYPSLYEGFGLPPLEAMLYECPVISSRTSSMPEVLGEAAEFFDPSQTESMSHAIERVVFFNERQQELVAKGMQRVKAFTWQACAERHMALYQSLSVARASLV